MLHFTMHILLTLFSRYLWIASVIHAIQY